MKLLKVLGATCLISGTAALGTYVYNGVREERMQKMFWDEMTVEKYNPVKYKELRDARNYDYKIWAQEAQKINDSLLIESAAKRARFRGEQLVADSVRTAVKTLKK